MNARLPQLLQNLCGLLAVAYSVWGSDRIDGESGVIGAAASLFVFALLDGRVARLTLALFPLLVVSQFALDSEPLRLLVAGLVLSGAIASLVMLKLDSQRRLPLFDAAAVAGTVVALFFLFPVSADGLLIAVAMIGAATALLVSSSTRRSVTLPTLAATILVVFVTPHDPIRLVLFPYVVAATLFALRRRSVIATVAALLLAAVAGKWALPIAALSLLSHVPAQQRNGAPFFALPATAAAAGIARLVILVPSFARSLTRIPLTVAGGVSLLIAIGVSTGRPQLLTLLTASAIYIVCALRSDRDDDVQLSIFVLAAAVLPFAWSGAMARVFPLPVTVAVAVLLAVILMMASARRVPQAMASAVAALALALIISRGVTFVSDGTSHEPISEGATVSQTMDEPARTVRVAISGAKLSALRPTQRVGSIEWVTHDGQGFRQELLVRDVADWGSFRAGAHFHTRNALPAEPAGMIEGIGRESWLRGTGSLAIRGARIDLVRVSAADDLHPPASLIVERIDRIE